MATRLHVIKLKADAKIPPDVLGWSATLEVPNDLPNLYEVQRHLQFLHENATLLVALLGAASTIFPNQKHHVSPRGLKPVPAT